MPAHSIPKRHDERVLRYVSLGDTGYRLLLWDTYETDIYCGKSLLGYAFYAPRKRKPLFSGEDFGASPLYCLDSDKTLRSLLCFLTLQPGDTDEEYFANYTPEQMTFATTEAEALQWWAMEEYDAPKFVNLPRR